MKNLDERLNTEVTQLASPEMTVAVEGDFVQYLTALYNDYMNSQRFTDPHSRAYLQHLGDEMKLVDCCKHVQQYYQERNNTHFNTVVLLQLRLLYVPK